MATRRAAPQPLAAYVLHHHDWSESSLILELFTREQGRVAAIAKGAKRPYSQLRAVLLPFQRIMVLLGSRREEQGTEVSLLRSAEWAGGGAMLGGDLGQGIAGFDLVRTRAVPNRSGDAGRRSRGRISRGRNDNLLADLQLRGIHARVGGLKRFDGNPKLWGNGGEGVALQDGVFRGNCGRLRRRFGNRQRRRPRRGIGIRHGRNRYIGVVNVHGRRVGVGKQRGCFRQGLGLLPLAALHQQDQEDGDVDPQRTEDFNLQF